jgi:1-pyrroline-5-carboxylate dehydrogenase
MSPAALWKQMKDDLDGQGRGLCRWARSTDFSNFMGAVIDERAFAKCHRRDRPGAGDRRT